MGHSAETSADTVVNSLGLTPVRLQSVIAEMVMIRSTLKYYKTTGRKVLPITLMALELGDLLFNDTNLGS